ncbi:MAG: 2Fe-2S iron-sulfur cluster-binding protein [Ginsengibacter sp.]|jgi:2Fe-2S ferredoxin
MVNPLNLIVFELIYLHETIKVSCQEGEFRNLMVLINEKLYVEDFGECKGIGRCGTCLVEIITKQRLPILERNEKSTLDKCAVKMPNLRLSCQIMINQLLHGARITIIEEREDVR